MDRVLLFLTSRKTTLVSAITGLAALLFDTQFVDGLQQLGVTPGAAGKLVVTAKMTTLALTSLGYSPLKRPATSPAAPADEAVVGTIPPEPPSAA